MQYKDLYRYVVEQTFKLNLFEADKNLEGIKEQLTTLRKLFMYGIENGPGRPISQDPILKGLADLINRNALVFDRLRKEAA